MTVEFKPKDLFQYKSAKRLFDNIREGSREVFAIGLARYCNYLGQDPDAIIADRKNTVREGIVNNDIEIQRQHEEKYAGFAAYLQGIKKADGGDLSPNTIASNMTASAAFYSRNYYPLQKPQRPDAYNVRPLHTPSADEMGKMLQIVSSDPLKSAMMAGAFQSGLGVGDLTKIKWADISEAYGSVKQQVDEGINVDGANRPLVHISRIRGKTHMKISTFFGRLTVSFLKHPDYPRNDECVFPFSVRAFEKTVQNASEQAGLKGQTTCHCIRKAFNTTLKMQNFNNDVIELWVGHSLGTVRGAYLTPPVESQAQLYLKAEPYLTPPQFSGILEDK